MTLWIPVIVFVTGDVDAVGWSSYPSQLSELVVYSAAVVCCSHVGHLPVSASQSGPLNHRMFPLNWAAVKPRVQKTASFPLSDNTAISGLQSVHGFRSHGFSQNAVMIATSATNVILFGYLTIVQFWIDSVLVVCVSQASRQSRRPLTPVLAE